eukprot:TRINITY_DN6246_c0_g1_i1.p1 TRINITY_DN6246_c0_g1~~TRINITY_DN6246_c0_g1_i1.p1  ORF type:complete len:585 (+),score=141.10 TRINITY_DN6246_c0_g1_i1:109-1863(+)
MKFSIAVILALASTASATKISGKEAAHVRGAVQDDGASESEHNEKLHPFGAIGEFFSSKGPKDGVSTAMEIDGQTKARHAIIQAVEPERWWGFPSYSKDLHEYGVRSWEQFKADHGDQGKQCNSTNERQICGVALPCKSGACTQCQLSRDCADKHYCHHFLIKGRGKWLCTPRDLLATWNWPEVVATVLIVLTAMLSAAAGMGGGGVYVPLLLLLLGFSTKEAVPLSQCMIVGGAIINIMMFAGDRHPKFPSKPRIDYDVIMMLNPGLAAGVTIGVMLNLITPGWIITTTLVVTLVLSLDKSLRKGLSEWAKESAAFAAEAALAAQGGGSGGTGDSFTRPANAPPKLTDGKEAKRGFLGSFGEILADNTRPICLIFGCWLVFLGLNLVKAPACSSLYWLQFLGMLAVCFAFTWAGQQTVIAKGAVGAEAPEGTLGWTEQTLWLYPLLSVVSGFLGGFLGIGGGIIMGPLLLELGMHPQASQATTAMFVFLSSSLATIQFVMLGKAILAYSLWFTVWVVVSTFVGQTCIDILLRKWKRSSPIVLSIAGIIAGSLVMMTMIGARDIYVDLHRGANMGFTPMKLCTR